VSADTRPANRALVEIAGPERAPFEEIIRRYLEMIDAKRFVYPDREAHYCGWKVERLSLVPTGEARLGQVRLASVKRKLAT
jgi:hypothetical protein